MALLAIHNGELVQAAPGLHATCPICDRQMIPKCGQIVIWHWAHDSLVDCDEWSEGESQWHLEWKLDLLKAGCRIEVPIVKYGQRHRADAVLPNGRIIELQSSYLSADDIAERERFYGSMLWLYRAHWWNDDRIYQFGDDGAFRWKHPALSVLTHQRAVFWDITESGTETFNAEPYWEQQLVAYVHLWRAASGKVYGKMKTGESPDEWLERILTDVGGQPRDDAPTCKLCGNPCYRFVEGDAVHLCCASNEHVNPGKPCPHCAASRDLNRAFQRKADEQLVEGR